MKKAVSILLLAVLLALPIFLLTGCGKYSSHWKAVGCVQSHTSKKASLSFMSFEGTMVYALKCKSDGAKLSYSGQLEAGNLKVYCDNGSAKTELFSLNAGETVNAALEGLKKGTVYIIIETSGTCKEGSLKFELE